MRKAPITSPFGVEVMLAASLVNATIEGVPNHSPPNHARKPYYSAIKGCYQLLTANMLLVKRGLGGVQNVYLRIVLPPKQYASIVKTPFVHPPNPDKTSTIPERTPPGKDKHLPREHK